MVRGGDWCAGIGFRVDGEYTVATSLSDLEILPALQERQGPVRIVTDSTIIPTRGARCVALYYLLNPCTRPPSVRVGGVTAPQS